MGSGLHKIQSSALQDKDSVDILDTLPRQRDNTWAVLKRGKKSLRNANMNQRSRGRCVLHGHAGGGGGIAVGGVRNQLRKIAEKLRENCGKLQEILIVLQNCVHQYGSALTARVTCRHVRRAKQKKCGKIAENCDKLWEIAKLRKIAENCGPQFSPPLGHGTLSTSKIGGWRWAGGGWWRLAVGSWWLVAVGGWRLALVGSWRLVAIGGWRLVVSGGCP